MKELNTPLNEWTDITGYVKIQLVQTGALRPGWFLCKLENNKCTSIYYYDTYIKQWDRRHYVISHDMKNRQPYIQLIVEKYWPTIEDMVEDMFAELL